METKNINVTIKKNMKMLTAITVWIILQQQQNQLFMTNVVNLNYSNFPLNNF